MPEEFRGNHAFTGWNLASQGKGSENFRPAEQFFPLEVQPLPQEGCGNEGATGMPQLSQIGPLEKKQPLIVPVESLGHLLFGGLFLESPESLPILAEFDENHPQAVAIGEIQRVDPKSSRGSPILSEWPGGIDFRADRTSTFPGHALGKGWRWDLCVSGKFAGDGHEGYQE